ncbi:protein YIPF1-like [Macrosteles quadrilineatus]|uniref:protein YIPF1-like n=1 Tax=Macrosteles quadrilineatus TaxID=74068 RepID=UPI0023E1F50A|nr:protein YIPF1-like [Macrosteles quadrilineatus]
MAAPNRGDKLIEIDSPPASFSTQLHFQEFTSNDLGGAAKLEVHNSHTLTFNQTPQTPGASTGASSTPIYNETSEKPSFSIWSLEYYQQLFDVNTDQVVERILWAMVPKPGVNFLQQHIQSKPDLYGPFWICVTLVFTIAISGNLANYLQTAASMHYHWKYNFHAVTLAGTAIFAYAWLLPSCLWGFLKYQGALHEGTITLLELLCVYGYSLAIYVPVSVLWVIQVGWLQWLLLIVGATMSGYVLVTAIWPAISQRSMVLLVVILGCHVLLAAGFMLSYFHASPPPLMPETPAQLPT